MLHVHGVITPWQGIRPEHILVARQITARREAALDERPLDVWLIEDNVHLRETLVELMAEARDLTCSLDASGCRPALDAIELGRIPDVVLMDLGLPGMSGVEGTRRITELSPSSQVVVLTAHDDDDRVLEALCAGAVGYLLKPASSQKVVRAVQTAAGGGSPMSAAIARKVLEMFTGIARPRQRYGLTDREREILELLIEEQTQREIAETLYLSPHTIDTHLRNIYRKLHVHSRTGAVAKALRERLV